MAGKNSGVVSLRFSQSRQYSHTMNSEVKYETFNMSLMETLRYRKSLI